MQGEAQGHSSHVEPLPSTVDCDYVDGSGITGSLLITAWRSYSTLIIIANKIDDEYQKQHGNFIGLLRIYLKRDLDFYEYVDRFTFDQSNSIRERDIDGSGVRVLDGFG